MDTSGPFPKPENTVDWTISIGIALLAIGSMAAGLFSIFFTFTIPGVPGIASRAANVSAGLAMPVLVALTAVYAYAAGEMARQAERDRKDKRDSVRRALLAEFESISISDWESLNLDMMVDSGVEEIFPLEFFDAYTDQLGLLTKDEVELLVRFHANRAMIQSHLAVLRSIPGLDTDQREEEIMNRWGNLQRYQDDIISELTSNIQ